MAIIDGVKNAVTAQVAARANKAVRAGLKKVSGNLLGISTTSDGPQLGAAAPRASTNKFSTKNLAYPLDVENNPKQGHYIFFNINVQDKAKIKSQVLQNKMRAHEKKIQSEYSQSIENARNDPYGFTPARTVEQVRASYIAKHAIEGFTSDQKLGSQVSVPNKSKGRKDSSSLQLQAPTTRRLKTAIALYMPPSVQVAYQSNYNDQEIGGLAQVAGSLLAQLKGGTMSVGSVMSTLADKGGQALSNKAMDAVEAVATGAKAILQIHSGRAVTPKMELMFAGVGRREFSYEFNFMPKSRKEAQVVEEIVYEFKFHMASDFTAGTGQMAMDIPSTFDIAYHYMGAENEHLNKISTRVLESVDVAYGGDRYIAYEDGVPQVTKLSLKFKEMEIITKSRIEEGF